jgi:hypothetical protein
LNVSWTFLECSSNVPWMFLGCSLNVPSTEGDLKRRFTVLVSVYVAGQRPRST